MPFSFLRDSRPVVRGRDGCPDPGYDITLSIEWAGPVCRSHVSNAGGTQVQIKEVVLFSGTFPFGTDTRFYGEGFQKLSQYGGTLASPVDIGRYSDRDHYRLPQTPGAFTVYSLLLLAPDAAAYLLMAFTSCHRFSGEFRLFPDGRFEIVVDTENLVLAPGETWTLEEFVVLSGSDRDALLVSLGERIAANHPPLAFPDVPTGWCSWYWYHADVTETDIHNNLAAIARAGLGLEYIQIDDGYQARMGDWLTPGDSFPGGIEALTHTIQAQGFEPAIWVAPFIAEADSQVFGEHPDWFVKDRSGGPLSSDAVSFGGWRRGPWYALDGTHPAVQTHLERVFSTMREAWGCSYFKLDANFWGALHGGRFHDPQATRIEAYRRGMEAVLRGAGDAFVLGCNAPMWASLGLVHGMRVTNDIGRSWRAFRDIARELFHRNWQNGRLWINDPDCIVLRDRSGGQPLTEQAYTFHATMILASGGMVLSGDDLTGMPDARMRVLRKLVPPTGVAARFADESFCLGRIDLSDCQLICILNWGDEPLTISVPLEGCCQIIDYWTGRDLGAHELAYELTALAPHAACVLSCTPKHTTKERQ